MSRIEDIIHIPLAPLTMRNLLENSHRRYAVRPALSFVGQEPMLYEDLYNSVAAVTKLLTDNGIGFGDHVAILAESSPHWAVAYFAITAMGAVAVPILVDFHQEAVQHIMRHAEIKAVFVSEKLMTKLGDSDLEQPLVLINIESFKPFTGGFTTDRFKEFKEVGIREFRKLRAMARRYANLVPREPREDDVAAIIYTSGTSGFSKGVVLTHRSIIFDAILTQDIISIDHTDRFLSILPLAHTYECTLGLILPMLMGAQVFYLDKPPTARVLLPALTEVKPTIMASVPLVIEKIFKQSIKPRFTANTLVRRLYAIPFFRRFLHRMAGRKLESTFGGKLRVLAIGGAPLAPDVDLFLYEAGFPYGLGYGLTENSPLAAGCGPGAVKPYSCGRVMPGLRVRIDSSDPQNEVGEILIKGPTVMREYYKAPELTEEVLDDDGWLHTGDLGTLDDEGYVFIKGRSKNMLLGPNGENIYPEEIEAQFLQSPYVLECLVYIHDQKLNCRVHLDVAKLDVIINGKDESKAAEIKRNLLEEMRAEVNLKLSSFAKIHKVIEQPEPFEKTATQKIKRYLYL